MKKNNIVEPEYIKTTNTDGDKFIGIKGEKNRISVYLPKCLDVSKDVGTLDERIEDVQSLIKCIKLSKVINADGDANNNNENKGTSMPIASYMYLIDDYRKNGIIVNREEIKTNTIRGKINWKQTIQQALIVSKGSIIFTNFISNFKTNTDNILIEIYRYCLKVALDRVGWLYKMNSNFIKILSVNESKNKYYINEEDFSSIKRSEFLVKEIYSKIINIK